MQEVQALLAAAPAFTALAGARVYPSRLPENTTFPAVVLTVVSRIPQATFESTGATALIDARLQVDCYAEQYDDAHSLADAAEDAFDAASARSSTLRIERIDTRDLFEDETLLHRASSDFSIWRGR